MDAPECIAFVKQHSDDADFMRGIESIAKFLAERAA